MEITEISLNFFSDDADRINAHLDSGQALCMVLNKDLPDQSVGQGVDYGYVLLAEYSGEERLVVANGCYKNPVKRFDRPDPEVIQKCNKAKVLMDGVYPARIFKKYLEEPLCILLNNSLSETQLEMFKYGYETFEIEHEDEMYLAIACILFDPEYQTEGKIIAQWYK